MPSRGIALAVLLWCACTLGACSGGADRGEFVDHMIATMDPQPEGASRQGWEETWACTYDDLSADDVDALMALDRDETADRALSTRVSEVIVECRGGVPTTTAPTSTAVPPTAAPAP